MSLLATKSAERDLPVKLPDDVSTVVLSRQNSNWTIAAFVLFVAGLVAAFKFPPLLDYANHYARLWLISGGISEAPFPQIYALDWNRTFTNIGIDLLARWLGPVIGVSLLARSLLFLAIVLPPLGAIALHRRLFGGSYHWQIAMLYFAWCATMIGGFINFQIGLGMALSFAAIDHALRPKGQAVLFLWRVVASLLLTMMHIFSLSFFVALLCGLEFSSSFGVLKSGRLLARLSVRLALAIVACVIPPLLLFLQAPHLPDGGGTTLDVVWNSSPLLIAASLLSAIWTYGVNIDAFLWLPIFLICYASVRAGRVRFHAGLMVTTIGLLIIACVSPRHLMGTGWISWRFSIMASLAGMAMICPLPNLQRRQALLLGLALSCIVLGRTAWVGVNWWRGQSDVRDVETVLAAVPPGSAILPLMHLSGVTATMPSHRYFAWRENTFRHLPTLAVPYAHAFVPTIFTAQGKQPLTVLAPWSDIAVPEGNLFSTAIMSCHALMERDVMFTPYLSNWRRRFDFVLVVNADIADRYVGDFLPRGLTLAGDTPFAKLYAIDKTVVAAVQDQPGCPTDLSTIE